MGIQGIPYPTSFSLLPDEQHGGKDKSARGGPITAGSRFGHEVTLECLCHEVTLECDREAVAFAFGLELSSFDAFFQDSAFNS